MRNLLCFIAPIVGAIAALVGSARAQTNVISGSAIVFASNITHPNGRIYDQVLLTGQSAVLQAEAGQVMRASFLDINGDIVQVEYSGPGRVTIALDPATYAPPAAAAKYNQPGVTYVTGVPTITIDDNTADSYVNVFTVGTVTALNASLFLAGEFYDGVADVALLQINGSAMGSVLAGNARFKGSAGKVGIYAPNTAVKYRAILQSLSALSSATPVLQFGAASTFSQDSGSILIGGVLIQLNNAAIDVTSGSGNAIVSLVTVANVRSDGTAIARQPVYPLTTFKGGANDTLLLDGTAATLTKPASGGPVTGKTLTFFAGTNPPFTNGATKVFDASPTQLRFDSTTLTNPTAIAGVNPPLTGYRFVDSVTGFTWEVFFNNGALHEINVMRGTTFAGQWQ